MAIAAGSEKLRDRPKIYGIVPSIFNEAVANRTQEERIYWWRAQAVAYLFRLNAKTSKGVLDLRTNRLNYFVSDNSTLPFPLPHGSIAMHIRHGDKAKEMKLVPAKTYLAAAEDLMKKQPLSFSKTLFVLSDDDDALAELVRLASQRHSGLVVAHTRFSNWRWFSVVCTVYV